MKKRDASESKKTEKPAITTDSLGRRKWDREFFARKAAERGAGGIAEEEKRPAAAVVENRGAIQARSRVANLEESVGRATVINAAAAAKEQGGFRCEVCEVTLKDSSAFLDHLNTPKHQRLKGHTTLPGRSTVEEVRARLARKRPTPTTTMITGGGGGIFVRDGGEGEEEEEGRKKKRVANGDALDGDGGGDGEGRMKKADDELERDEMAAIADLGGLPLSFGTTKKQS